MTDTFDDLKIDAELLAGVEALGWDAPSALQRDAAAVVRRGNNVVLNGSAGAGVVGAYALGILDRLLQVEDAPGRRAVLVLTGDARTASATADSIARLAGPTELAVRATAEGWVNDDAPVLVTTPSLALADVQSSTLKLDGVLALVIDGADAIADSDQWSPLETLVDAVPASAQRVLVTGRFDEAVEGFIERHVRKAMTVPPRGEPKATRSEPPIRYAVVSEPDKPAAAVYLLAGMEADQVAVVCRAANRVEAVERSLTARGIDLHGDGVLVLPRTEADQRSIQAQVLSYDVPFDTGELDALHGNGGAVLVTPRERAHLLRMAGRAGKQIRPVALPTPAEAAVESLRGRLRELADGDLTAELALLAPLFSERSAAEIAAAALRLGRTGVPAPPPDTGRTGKAPPPKADTWVHLFLSIGSRDDVGPGDLVGAITGEADVSGDDVGRIDIRETYTTVEVAAGVAGRVIEALNGRTLKGRSLRVDYDRRGRGSKQRPGR